MSILEIENISYDYTTKAGKVHALKSATAKFEKGTVYAIVGRSGSGKSTFISLLAGLDVPKDGKVFYNGTDLAKADRDRYRREHVGMIFQSFYLLPQLTALENVELTLQLAGFSGNKRKRASETLLRMGIEAAQFRKHSLQFSGGEQQRIAIARAIAPDPEIILADEPTGNLDNENSQNIVNILSEMAHKDGKCVIIITHAAEVASCADVILHMSDGILSEE